MKCYLYGDIEIFWNDVSSYTTTAAHNYSSCRGDHKGASSGVYASMLLSASTEGCSKPPHSLTRRRYGTTNGLCL